MNNEQNEILKLKGLLERCRYYLASSDENGLWGLIRAIDNEIGDPAKYKVDDNVYIWYHDDFSGDVLGQIVIRRTRVTGIRFNNDNKSYEYDLEDSEKYIDEDYIHSSIIDAKNHMIDLVERL